MLDGKEERKKKKKKNNNNNNKIEIFAFGFLDCDKSWDSGATFYIRIPKGFHL